MALRAGSVGLGREAGLGARRGWTRRRRPLPRPGRPPVLSARARPPLFPAGPRRPPRRRHLSSPPPSSRRGAGRGSARGAGSGAAGPTPRGFRSGRNQRAPGGAGGPDTRGGRRRRRLWTRAGPFPWIASAAAGVAAAPGEPGGCRRGSPPRGASLHPPHRLSRGAWRGRAGVPRVWGEPPRRCSPAGSAPRAAVFRAAPRLGRRLAADLELVRTRGIRLFN